MMSNENNEVATSRVANFYSKNGWWYAAAALMLVVAIGAVALIVLPGKDSDPSDLPLTTSPVDPPLSSVPASGPSASPTGTGWDDLGCNGQRGSVDVPTEAPDATWEPVGVMSAPTSKTLGPLSVESFVRSCYQHTPTGAVVAGINIVTAIATAPEDELRSVVEAGLTPGQERDQSLSKERGQLGWKVAAFHIESCAPERCNVVLVVSADGALGVLNLPMVWSNGDWRVDGTVSAGGGGVEQLPPGYVAWGA